ncbi:hypothetical protein CHUAL_009604 [Chamberlinius hualienensis]
MDDVLNLTSNKVIYSSCCIASCLSANVIQSSSSVDIFMQQSTTPPALLQTVDYSKVNVNIIHHLFCSEDIQKLYLHFKHFINTIPSHKPGLCIESQNLTKHDVDRKIMDAAEQRLRCVMKLFMMGVQSKSPALLIYSASAITDKFLW